MSTWIKVALVALAIGAAIWTARAWEESVYQRGWAAAETKLRGESDRRIAEETEVVLERERELSRGLRALQTAGQKEREDHEKAIAAERARARAGDVRLRIAVAAAEARQCPDGGDPAVTASPGGETHADVLPAVADAVLGIAGDIAKHVLDFNEIQERYERVRAACNGQ